MSEKSIIVLIYHRRKLLDLTPFILPHGIRRRQRKHFTCLLLVQITDASSLSFRVELSGPCITVKIY
jgi:hypothetical protein